MKLGITAAIVISASAPAPLWAQQQPFEIKEQDLANALRLFAATSGREVVASSALVAGKRSRAVSGTAEPEAALAKLLTGTDLRFEIVEGAFVIRPLLIAEGDGPAPPTVDIVVTGTRIRGAAVASPVVQLDREQARNEGRGDLGDVIRHIPQTFGGGQNPGIGNNVPAASGGDVGGGSSLNLRGLGSDATLTLLNGHRLAYTAAIQSVDVSSIPLAAVDRIEIVPDGASAIYGSDAIAGVANIILRRDFEGLQTGARLAATSGGGDFQQRYDAIAGQSWSSGGVMAAYEHGSNTAIRADDRPYAATRSPGLDLYPALRHDSLVASAHQEIASGLTASVDGLYNIRWSQSTSPTLPGGDLSAGRATFFSVDKSFGVATSFELALTDSWRLSLSGTYGAERVDFHQIECTGTDCADDGANFYRNTAKSLELAASGDLLKLPGGTAKLALGGGYRAISFRRFSAALSAVNTSHDQSSEYVFGELNLPLLAPAQALPLFNRIDLNIAGRFEHYAGIGGVLTPKIGVVWGLTPDLAIKGSWGRSFRAPTLYQQYQPRAAVLYPPRFLGAPQLPSTAAVLLVLGGTPDLKPERATTWSATIDLHPRALPGASLEVSYFNVAYQQRIVSPIGLLAQALSNPLYADQVTRNPSAAAQAALIAGASSFTNFVGFAYDPSNVVAIVDNAYVNAGRQTARGVDVLARYVTTSNDGNGISLSADVAYLDSNQRLTPLQPTLQLAGTIFNPPHWRGAASASWSSGPLTLTADGTYTGGVRDTRFTPVTRVRGMAMADLSARYRLVQGPAVIRGLEFTVSVQNLFNAKPDPISTTAPYDTPYDSTNYSPIGRLIALEVRKSW